MDKDLYNSHRKCFRFNKLIDGAEAIVCWDCSWLPIVYKAIQQIVDKKTPIVSRLFSRVMTHEINYLTIQDVSDNVRILYNEKSYGT